MIATKSTPVAVADIELQLLLEAVYRVSGYDFREYTPAVVKRRVAERQRSEGAATISGLLERVVHNEAAMARFVHGLSVSPGSLFREPAFFAAFRERVAPMLRTFPFVRIWVPGCGTGEDVYALAIALAETGLASRARIYATDLSESALDQAKAGAIDVATLEDAAYRYAEGGGARRLRDYVSVDGTTALFDPALRQNVLFAQHSLATDTSFNEFHAIVARNVLTQFNKNLAYRVHQVVLESLVRLGYLGLGARESLRFTPHQRAYEELAGTETFYRRVR